MAIPDKTAAPAAEPLRLPDLPEPPQQLRQTPGFSEWEYQLRAWWKRVRETLQRNT